MNPNRLRNKIVIGFFTDAGTNIASSYFKVIENINYFAHYTYNYEAIRADEINEILNKNQ
jgi:hypothetical protein